MLSSGRKAGSLRQNLLAVAAFVVVFVTALGEESDRSPVERAKVRLAVEEAEIDLNFNIAISGPLERYGRHLEVIEAALVKEGNLDGVLEVRGENERFRTTRVVPSADGWDGDPRIAEARVIYSKAAAKPRSERDEKLAKLYHQFVQHLDKLQEDLTRQNLIEEAIDARRLKAAYREKVELLRTGRDLPDGPSPGSAGEKADPKPVRDQVLGYTQGRHRSGAVSHGGHWYLLVQGQVSWEAAKLQCREMGGYLATVTTNEECEFLVDYGKPHNGSRGNIWVGGEVRDGEIHWVTGEVSADDVPFEPVHPRYTHCVLWMANRGIRPIFPTGKNNAGKELIKGFICEWDQ